MARVVKALAALLPLLPALAGCAERCPAAPSQPVFGGRSGVACRLLTDRGGHGNVACFKACPPALDPARATLAPVRGGG